MQVRGVRIADRHERKPIGWRHHAHSNERGAELVPEALCYDIEMIGRFGKLDGWLMDFSWRFSGFARKAVQKFLFVRAVHEEYLFTSFILLLASAHLCPLHQQNVKNTLFLSSNR